MDTDDEPHHIPELWIEDGNIIIEAGNSRFRVHRSTLGAYSPVFRDMLVFPQPPDSELVDGCPLVLLHDSEMEVTVFLKALFKPDYFKPFPATTEYPIIQGCLRLSHKYEVDFLRLRSLIHLSSCYRTTLSEWDIDEYHTDVEDPSSHRLSEMASWSLPEEPGYIVSLIQLAREVEATWILPGAFYRLGVLSGELIAELFFGTMYKGSPARLSEQDQKAFLRGHLWQTQASTAHTLGFLTTPPVNIPGCPFPAACLVERASAIEALRKMIKEYPSIPLAVWDESDWALLQEACIGCRRALKEAHNEARMAIWDELPKKYGLPPWEELEKMKTEAIGARWWLS
ncbi:hypothetical protein FB45DRAFT_1037077 [Roridomyces roridus]|uniref:BTB domain-containing protein n=1 Tax=Roridomyces roridus TaxID=1738132 RepID=A0AAD7B6G3_9AGAR|nr:hypothetical protein FB45DRAFT_1037077 [Roridomyces roridus]